MSDPLAPQAEGSSRTLVCSVLFVDIAGYSRRGVSEQIRLKQKFNEVLAGSLADLAELARAADAAGDPAAAKDYKERSLAVSKAMNGGRGPAEAALVR